MPLVIHLKHLVMIGSHNGIVFSPFGAGFPLCMPYTKPDNSVREHLQTSLGNRIASACLWEMNDSIKSVGERLQNGVATAMYLFTAWEE